MNFVEIEFAIHAVYNIYALKKPQNLSKTNHIKTTRFFLRSLIGFNKNVIFYIIIKRFPRGLMTNKLFILLPSYYIHVYI